MSRIGKFVLFVFHSFHRWHRHHLKISLALLLIPGIASLVGLRRWEEHLSGWAEALEHVIVRFSVRFFLVYVVLLAIAKLLSKLWPPPIIPLLTTIAEPLHRPAQGHWTFGEHFGPKFRYRFANQGDLEIFVDYSMADPAIVIANPELNPHERLALYTRWFSRTSRSFMLLEMQGAAATEWTPVAVSIVLPLSQEGAQDIWTGRVRVVEITQSHVCASNQRPLALLIDTLIVKRDRRSRLPRLVYGLVAIHNSRFWVPQGRKRIEYWIEPDHEKLPKILRDSGFEGPHPIGPEHSLYALNYPPARRRLSERQRETVERIFDNIRTCAGWHIE